MRGEYNSQDKEANPFFFACQSAKLSGNMRFWMDAHCHLADPRLAAELPRIMERSRAAGIHGWVQGGVGPEDWDRQVELRAIYGASFITSFGLHPWKASSMTEAEISQALEQLTRRLPVADALGETGLDYSPRFTDSERQRQHLAFERQLEILRECPKPLILHVVGAHADALRLLEARGAYPRGGMVHSFSASREIAESYLSLGFSLSICGVVLKRGFQNLKSALSSLPLDKILVETDSPDQSPIRGTLNEPANLPRIAEAIGNARGLSGESILDQSTENLKKLFGLG